MAGVSNGAGERAVGAVGAAGSAAETTTVRTSVGIRRLVPVRDCRARSEESDINATV